VQVGWHTPSHPRLSLLPFVCPPAPPSLSPSLSSSASSHPSFLPPLLFLVLRRRRGRRTTTVVVPVPSGSPAPAINLRYHNERCQAGARAPESCRFQTQGKPGWKISQESFLKSSLRSFRILSFSGFQVPDSILTVLVITRLTTSQRARCTRLQSASGLSESAGTEAHNARPEPPPPPP
jgi:hypothetical protein